MKISLIMLGMICITGMISLPSISAQTPELNAEQPIYEKLIGQSTITKFFGYIDSEQKGARVILSIISPTGVVSENRIYPTDTGYFELFHYLDKHAETGLYDVNATYHDVSIGNTSFELADNKNYSLPTKTSILNEKSEIPSWIKNVFVWYGDDMVSEKELLSAIKFLVNDGIINLDN
jgi:hypothetical protein